MTIGSICQRTVVTIDHRARLSQAARLMRDAHVGALVVTAEQAGAHAVLGIVTDRDVVLQVLAREDARSLPDEIGQLASDRVVAIDAAASLSDAIERMEAEGVRRLLVKGPGEALVGIVSIDDVVEALGRDLSRLAQALKHGRERETAHAKTVADRHGTGTIPRFGTAGSAAGWTAGG